MPTPIAEPAIWTVGDLRRLLARYPDDTPMFSGGASLEDGTLVTCNLPGEVEEILEDVARLRRAPRG